MKAFLTHFQSFPSSAKNGIIVMIIAWLWMFFTLYRYFLAGQAPDERLIVAGIMACTLIFKVRNWSRVLCMLGNVLAMVVHLQLAIQFSAAGLTHYAVVACITIGLFAVATVFLAVPQTAQFYKAHTPTPSDGRAEAGLDDADDPKK